MGVPKRAVGPLIGVRLLAREPAGSGRRVTRLTHASWFVLGGLCLGGCGDAEPPLGLDRDGDGWPEDLDCEDGNPSIFPAADDIPDDGIDQDCSGSDAARSGGLGGSSPCAGGDCAGAAGAPTSSGGASGGASGGTGAAGEDADGDGHLSKPTGDDCDDQRPDVHPLAREVVLNGIDENCDGSDLVGQDEVIPILSLEAMPAAAPDLASGESGGNAVLLAVWSDSRNAPGQDLYGQLLDADGEALGPEIAIDTTDNAAKSGVRVASRGDGFLVTWATADGVWARQLGADGTPEGIVLGFGGVGATEPVPAFAAEYWAIAWLVPTEQRAEIRATTADGVRGDIQELGAGEISSVSLAGGAEGFVAVWEGPTGESTRGLLAQSRTVTAFPAEDPVIVFAGAASSPGIAFNGDDFLVAFSLAGTFGYAAAQRLGEDLSPADPTAPLRLSSESVNQSTFRLAARGEDFSVLWNDARHLSHVPPADSIYGSWVESDGPTFPSGTALLADQQAQLGGVAFLADHPTQLFVSVLSGSGPGLLIVEP